MTDEAELVWNHRKGWVLRNSPKLTDAELLKMCAYAINSQVDRLNSMPNGHPKKKLLEFAIGELQKLRVTQEVTTHNLHSAGK